jgi:hypothetical protein
MILYLFAHYLALILLECANELASVLPIAELSDDEWYSPLSVSVQSTMALLHVDSLNLVIVVIGGVDVVARLQVILHLPHISWLGQGRPR